MLTRMQTLSPQDINRIHQASMAILSRSGVVFNDDECVDIFKKHGVKVEGRNVYPTEEQVMKALASAPARFTVKALNPEKNDPSAAPTSPCCPVTGRLSSPNPGAPKGWDFSAIMKTSSNWWPPQKPSI